MPSSRGGRGRPAGPSGQSKEQLEKVATANKGPVATCEESTYASLIVQVEREHLALGRRIAHKQIFSLYMTIRALQCRDGTGGGFGEFLPYAYLIFRWDRFPGFIFK